MNTFILLKNPNDGNMRDIATKNKDGSYAVWATVLTDAFFDAGETDTVLTDNKYLMDFTLTEVKEQK